MMTFTGEGISDDEANSWDEELSESEESADNYYDEEDEEDHGPTKRKNSKGSTLGNNHDSSDDDDNDEGTSRLVMNVHCTDYEVVKKVARKSLGYKLKYYAEDHDGAIRKNQHSQKLVKEWDITWHDLSITPDFLTKLNPF